MVQKVYFGGIIAGGSGAESDLGRLSLRIASVSVITRKTQSIYKQNNGSRFAWLQPQRWAIPEQIRGFDSCLYTTCTSSTWTPSGSSTWVTFVSGIPVLSRTLLKSQGGVLKLKPFLARFFSTLSRSDKPQQGPLN